MGYKLTPLLIALVLTLGGCTGDDVWRAADELDRHNTKIGHVQDGIAAATAALDLVGLSDDDRARVETVLARLDTTLGELEARTPELTERLRTARLAGDRTVGNALVAGGEFGATAAQVVGGWVGSIIGGLSAIALGVGGWLNTRRERAHTQRIVDSIDAAKVDGVINFGDKQVESVIDKVQGRETRALVEKLRS